MNTEKVVITGAPGTGKTSVIEGLEKRGFHCFHEIIRTMTAQAKAVGTKKKPVSNPLTFVDDPHEFNRLLLEGRFAQFQEAENLKKELTFFDRGMPDVLAYMNYFNQEYDKTFTDTCKNNPYQKIFILPPWKEIYVSDNERLETFTEAEKLHKHLVHTYQKFGYSPIYVPKNSVEERISFILNAVNFH